jgi:hypothetical protein
MSKRNITSISTGALVVTRGVGGTMTAFSIVKTSSIIFKENILPINGALDDTTKLSGVVYDRLGTKEREAGLISEHVYDVFSDLVTKDIDGNMVGIKYTKLTAYLIESVKTLKEEINELRELRYNGNA